MKCIQCGAKMKDDGTIPHKKTCWEYGRKEKSGPAPSPR